MNSKNKKITALVVFVLVLIIITLFVLNTKVSAAVSDSRVKISSFWYTKEISYSDIASVNIYTGDFEYGEKLSGVSFIRSVRGTYENELLGQYKCATNKKVGSYIVVKMKDGECFVFNSIDASHTSEIYNFIKPKTVK